MKNWADIGFTLEKTQDGSPTLRRKEPSRSEFTDGEAMHHTGGALDETLYIYRPVIEQVKIWAPESPKFVSVGLGLGYVEMIVAFYNLERSFEILSFEAVPELTEYFRRWIFGESLNPEVQGTYDDLAERIAGSQVLTLKECLRRAWSQERLVVKGPMEQNLTFKPIFQGIMYDAYSRAVSPQLWTGEFLRDFLKSFAAPQSCLASYSCMGELKRALKDLGFTVEVKVGFKGKRNCTWAFRQSTSADL